MPRVEPYRIVALFGILIFGSSSAATAPEVTSIEVPKNILFIGNSYTYYNNSLHNVLRALIRSADMGEDFPGLLKAMTISGARLVDHAPAVQAIVDSQEWDVVVLQGHSREAIDKDEVKLFHRAGRAYDKIIDDSGADTVFYMTWAPEDHPDYIESLNTTYTLIGNHTDALVVPVGLAFHKVTQEYPGIDLYRPDKSHPTVAGTYLAACVFYAALYQKSPAGLTFPTSTAINETKAAILQQMAWQTVQEYYAQTDQMPNP
jgi:hypothetical protein